MRIPDADAILRRIRANFDSHSHDGGDRVHSHDPATYTDAALYAAEVDALFRNRPQFVCHASQLREPGDFVTHEIAGTSIIVVRGGGGSLHAHVNACPHRGAKVELAACGNRPTFSCPFHAWTFRLDGTLDGVTDRPSFDGAALDRANLLPVTVAERHGLVFVNMGGGPAEPELDGMAAQFATLGLENFTHHRSVTVEHRFNWKLAMDGSLESYHLNHAHPVASPAYSGYATVFDFYGRNTRFVTARRRLAKGDLPPADELLRHSMCTFHMFPNAFVTTPLDHVLLQLILPIAVDRTAVTMSLLKPRDAGPELDEHWDKSWEMNQAVMVDDFAIWETIQANYAGGFAQPAMFGRFEFAIPRFHEHCRELVGR